MGYRDEVTNLRNQLAAAKEEIARLRGERLRVVDKPNFFLGAPTELNIRDSFEGRTDDETLGEVVAALEDNFDQTGETGQVGRHLKWQLASPNAKPHIVFTVKGSDGNVEIHARHSMANSLLAGYVVLLLVAVVVVVIVSALKRLGLVVAPVVIGLISWSLRNYYQAGVAKHEARLRAAVAATRRIMETPPRVRVEDDAERQAEAELEAIEEAMEQARQRE